MAEFTQEEKQHIQDKFDELISVANLIENDEQLDFVVRAFNLSNSAHNNMRRKSGEPYVLHPIEVARICTHEIGLGTKSIVAALLHDVVEDTDYTLEDIK